MSSSVKIEVSDGMIRRYESGQSREREHDRTRAAGCATTTETAVMWASALGYGAKPEHLAQSCGLLKKDSVHLPINLTSVPKTSTRPAVNY